MSKNTQLKIGDTIPIDYVDTINQERVLLKGGVGLVHLQFRRYSACPICNIHLRNYANKLSVLKQQPFKAIVVFHSAAAVILENSRGTEWSKVFQFVADPERNLYKQVGAEFSGWRYFIRLKPQTLWVGLLGLPGLLQKRRWGAEAGVTQRPMDLLLDCETGKIIDLHYGLEPNDQWSVEQVISLIEQYTQTHSGGLAIP